MEPGSRAERFLTPKIRQASARAILVLAAAAILALSGCGDDSSDERTASAPASQGKQAETGPPAGETLTSGPNPVPGPGSKASSGQGEQGPEGQGKSSQGTPSPEVPVPSGEREKGITPRQRAEATTQSMRLESPTLRPPSTGGVPMLAAANTCDGEGIWPELAWQGVPPDTAELALFAMSLRPAEGELSYSWTVAGIDPDLTGIPAGRLPKGAVMGRNSFGKVGYTVCPPKGSSETYIFTLYALPKRLTVRSGFDPNALRREVGQLSSNGGVMAVGYRRG
jgi:phosphatidylethanolamine-binding protein (PEBP) family uncharacterized protein